MIRQIASILHDITETRMGDPPRDTAPDGLPGTHPASSHFETTESSDNLHTGNLDGRPHRTMSLTDDGQSPLAVVTTAESSLPHLSAPPSANKASNKSPPRHSYRQAGDTTTESSPILMRMRSVPEDGVPEEGAKAKKNVQFTGGAVDTSGLVSPGLMPVVDGEASALKSSSLRSRLRALASAQGGSHGRSTDARDRGSTTPAHDGSLVAVLDDDNTETEADADTESGLDGTRQPRKRRRRQERSKNIDSVPSSPENRPRPSSFFSSTRRASPSPARLVLPRRATDTDLEAAVSEGEGKKRIESPSAWSPRHPLRGLSYGMSRRQDTDPPNDSGKSTRVQSNDAHGVDGPNAHDQPPRVSRRRLLAERGTTYGATKWKQLKHGMAFARRDKKKEPTPDQKKSAELLAELQAGSPAALMLASMFQRDEHGSRRVPALLEQLKVSITDSGWDEHRDGDGSQPTDRHMVFRIELEYGNGVNRMKWTVKRSLREFANLHAKYKLHYKSEQFKGRGTDATKRMPRFPKKAFTVLDSYAGLDDEDDDGTEGPPGGPDSEATDNERPGMSSRSRTMRQSFVLRRRASSPPGDQVPTTPGGTLLFRRNKDPDRDKTFPERQRKMLELYLQSMIKFMLFRPDANRLCKFLELSALGMRLSSEGSYHGKEGFLVIQSAKGVDFRKRITPENLKNRHLPKWFLVRHSYIVCVDSPEAMHIYDVFLFDADFKLQSTRVTWLEDQERSSRSRVIGARSKEKIKHPRHHRLKLQNAERKLKLVARNEKVSFQFEESIKKTIETSEWCKKHRFDSFAPVRHRCFAQWLVDGRDHMWVISRALDQAKDVIYIHDWWLSPELYMRRPGAISQKWRLDRLLKRKAEQGVKVFVIVYRNIDAAVPIDSQYTKFSLLDLHSNIFVQRSPNQFRQNTFFWAHHEKLCIVDHTVAFVGGIDLCFGRWDTPQHILTDDKPTGFDTADAPRDADHCQLWPGKDYSNPRVQDFYTLNKPYEEMYDRTVVARMPWHDVSMQIVGQPARDLTRHFVQRWNYILRQRKPTRPTPFLLPPPDFNPADLESLGLDGTCEVQLLRSAGPWSIGTPDKTEHSIMNAYVKMIEESEHFVYMENQFFITSCETEGSVVFNKIGDALVERIVRAYNNDEAWRAMILIPLIPGFQNTVEEEGGTSVRLIMQYQFRSICRGDSSIFGRLRAKGIDPEDYIQFYGLRQWGKLGPKQVLVTEQLYIHAKIIIVDDRVALIGSANINERSQLGNRDSEVAAVVRDTDMFWSKMNGLDYRVGRFAHTLRMRLMREHLGLDVDQIMEDAQILEQDHQQQHSTKQDTMPTKETDDDHDPLDERGRELQTEYLIRNEHLRTFNGDVDWEQAKNPNLVANKKVTRDNRVTDTQEHKDDVEGRGEDNMAAIDAAGLGAGRDTVVLRRGKEVLIKAVDPEGHKPLVDPLRPREVKRLPSYVRQMEMPDPPPPVKLVRMETARLGLPMLSTLPPLPDLDDSDIGGPALERTTSNASVQPHHPLLAELRFPVVDRNCMLDPLHYTFSEDLWHIVAENNTKIYRSVFRCMPDNQVRDWADYHEYLAYEQRFDDLQGRGTSGQKLPPGDRNSSKRAGPPGVGASATAAHIKAITHIPTDIAERVGELKDKHTSGGHSGIASSEAAAQDKKHNEEKMALRHWAAEANRQQMQRTHTDLTLRTFPSFHEGDPNLQTVPEDRPASHDSKSTSEIHHHNGSTNEKASLTGTTATATASDSSRGTTAAGNGVNGSAPRRRRRGTTRSSRRNFSAADDIISLAEAEELLGKVQGHLIEWPYDW